MDNDKIKAATDVNVEDAEFSAEETKAQMKRYENDILKGMLAAASFKTDETKEIEIVRGGVMYFSFHIRALSENEYEKAKKRCTKYVRNKQLGIKMPEDTNSVLYKSELIYMATTDEDRKKTWDNHQLWDALNNAGHDIVTGTDVVDAVLMSGEKAAIVNEIDDLSGYVDDNLEEVIKN